jgi:hypothetical protein
MIEVRMNTESAGGSQMEKRKQKDDFAKTTQLQLLNRLA